MVRSFSASSDESCPIGENGATASIAWLVSDGTRWGYTTFTLGTKCSISGDQLTRGSWYCSGSSNDSEGDW